ncbi:MAG: putative toxin-antitoxin system toxin component, PIN family [Microscillaceae bacterium]|nr:putative toxin-antitoxin system toxin component, PIN family [Microscillaceae bacterium]
MRIVLDTNLLLVSISRKSKYRPIFDAILDGKCRLLISNEILSEYAEILEQKTNNIVAFNITEFLVQSIYVEKVEVYYRWQLIEKDTYDDKFVDCAVSGNANFLVTDDKHFEVLKEVRFPLVDIIKTADFLEEIKKLE